MWIHSDAKHMCLHEFVLPSGYSLGLKQNEYPLLDAFYAHITIAKSVQSLYFMAGLITDPLNSPHHLKFNHTKTRTKQSAIKQNIYLTGGCKSTLSST